jgi:hypothetical protein
MIDDVYHIYLRPGKCLVRRSRSMPLAKRKSFARFRKRLPIVTAIKKTNYFRI